MHVTIIQGKIQIISKPITARLKWYLNVSPKKGDRLIRFNAEFYQNFKEDYIYIHYNLFKTC